ncbi:hypothetical protein [Oceanobacillus sp. CAU 1775]
MIDLNFLKSIKGKIFGGIYGKILHIHNHKDELVIHCSNPLISFHSSQGSMDDRFWSFDWDESKTGEDMLLVNEHKTPEPLDYEVIESPNQKYVISASSYYPSRENLIQEVLGYGFLESDEEILTTVVIKLEDSFILLVASPAIEIKITDEKPVIEENLSLIVSS